MFRVFGGKSVTVRVCLKLMKKLSQPFIYEAQCLLQLIKQRDPANVWSLCAQDDLFTFRLVGVGSLNAAQPGFHLCSLSNLIIVLASAT